MNGSRRLCVVLMVALGAAGCGAGQGAPLGAAGGMRFVATAPPAGATTPGRGPINLVFVTPGRGFAATTGGSRDVAREGWVLPSEPGEIERTRDGGVTWRTLWRGRLAFDSLAVRGRVIVAAGTRLPETGGRARSQDPPRAQHVLLVSRDGGRTWIRRRLPVRGRVALQILAPRRWLAFRDREYDIGPRATLLRSDDAGGHWVEVPVPAGTQVVRFGTPATGVASAYAQACRGGTRVEGEPRLQLWHTSDGGQTWRPIAGTCASQFVESDIDFVGPRLAFAVQGNEDIDHFRGVLRRSADGGATWTTVAREHGREPLRVQFGDRRHGALVESVAGPGYQDFHNLLATTTDGGRTWARHGLPADSLDSDDTVTPTPAILGRNVWIGHTRSGVVWHTDDGGLRWTLTTAPRSLDPGSDGYVTNLLVGPGWLMVSSAAGPVESRDGGRTWTTARWPSAEDVARDEGRGAYVILGNHRDRARLLTPTGSQPLGLPPGVRRLSDVAFANARDGLLVAYHGAYVETPYVTHDGGGTWAAIAPPSRRPGDYMLAPGVIVDVAAPTEWVTTDDGASWQPLGHVRQYDYCVPSRASALDLWITCNSSTPTTLSYSGDGGRTWTRHVSHRQLGPPVGGTGGPEAWATGVSANVDGGATRLWHTTDGGATWTQVWVSLPSRAPAREIDCAIMPSGVLHAPLAACR